MESFHFYHLEQNRKRGFCFQTPEPVLETLILAEGFHQSSKEHSPSALGVYQSTDNSLAAIKGTRWSLCQKDPLEKEMATHSSVLAWRIEWTEELGGLQSVGSEESNTTEVT